MKPGDIVEYIDRDRILCAVVQEVKKQRLLLLTENNREVNLSSNRLLPERSAHIESSRGRNHAVDMLKKIAQRRRALIDEIDIKELWEVLNTEQEWIDLQTMTAFCFPNNPTPDHQSAVVRAFFHNRLYFKFNRDHFFPNPEALVEKTIAKEKALKHRNRMIEKGGNWLKAMVDTGNSVLPETFSYDQVKIIDALKSYYLFGKESTDHSLAKTLLKFAKIEPESGLFNILVALGVFDPDENIALLRYETPIAFPDPVIREANRLIEAPLDFTRDPLREDLSHLKLMTIDGRATRDFDDALGIEKQGDDYLLSIHISDVGALIKRGSKIDKEAFCRASSIYMPDKHISMLPPILAEEFSSLIAGRHRPAISTLIRIKKSGEIVDYRIVPSYINVRHNLSYYEVNQVVEENEDMAVLYRTAKRFREKRLSNGAIQITLPEVHVWINEEGEVVISRVNRESPSRMIISEIMIMTNRLTAEFLAEKRLPAIYRSQPEPKERLLKGTDEGTVFQNCLQRRRLNRFILRNSPKRHSGLGLNAYVTATSPIRKYFDLATQRQIRAVFGLEEPYSAEEINQIIQSLEISMRQVSRIQFLRNRYWLLKYLETRIGKKKEALVLYRRRNCYQILLTEYMLECLLPLPGGGIDLKPGSMIYVTLQHVSPTKDTISVFMG